MTVKEKFKNLLNIAFDVLAPEHECMSCGKEIPDGTTFMLCENCKKSIIWLSGKTCAKCGELLNDDSLICNYCKDVDYVFAKNTSCCYYGEASSAIIKGLKYNSRKYYAKHIAEIMVLVKSAFENIDELTYVPISKSRKRIRGYNQSEEIAKEIGKLLNLPVKDYLVKVSDGKHQANLNKAERLKNLSGSIALAPNADKEIKGKRILIIDDVFTTGATANECTKVLLTAKPKYIAIMTFAKTKLGDVNL